MKTYHIEILGYNNQTNSTETRQIVCDGVLSNDWYYEFFNRDEEGYNDTIAYYPICNTIIKKIEKGGNR